MFWILHCHSKCQEHTFLKVQFNWKQCYSINFSLNHSVSTTGCFKQFFKPWPWGWARSSLRVPYNPNHSATLCVVLVPVITNYIMNTMKRKLSIWICPLKHGVYLVLIPLRQSKFHPPRNEKVMSTKPYLPVKLIRTLAICYCYGFWRVKMTRWFCLD